MIKKSILYVLFLASSMHICAQIPNFGTTVGDQKLYGYSSMKYRAKADTWETYSTLQYGIGNHFQPGVDLYTNGAANYIGYIPVGGIKKTPEN